MRGHVLLRKTATVAGMTALSRVLGLVREVLMAHFFGTTLARSAFDVAFRVPNLFRRLFGEGALSAAFVPVFTRTLEREGVASARQILARTAALLALFLGTVVALAVVVVSLVLAHVELGPRIAAVLPLLRIMLPYAVFICLVALCMGALNGSGHFAVPAATPVVLNVVWIAVIFFASRIGGADFQGQMVVVAWGIVVAGIVQLAVQVPILQRQALVAGRGDVGGLGVIFSDRRIRSILLAMAPAALGTGIHQINVMIDGVLALWVGDWGPAALTGAERLVYLPLGVFATALGTVLLPVYSKQAAQAGEMQMAGTRGSSLMGLMAVMGPAAAGLAMLATPIVRGIYQWPEGEFGAMSVVYTSRALACYAPGLVVWSIYKVLVPAFYAMGDTRTPMRVGLYAVGLNLVLNVTFVLTWPEGYGHAGLATATVLSSLFNCVVLGVALHRRGVTPAWARVWRAWGRIALVCAGLVAALWLVAAPLQAWGETLPVKGKYAELLVLAGQVSVGLGVAILGLACLARTELRLLRR
jgi:putative peptidoglycan lipid II flippase